LSLRQAIGTIAALALQYLRVEAAKRWVLNQPISQPIVCIASLQCGGMDHRVFTRGDEAVRRAMHGLGNPNRLWCKLGVATISVAVAVSIPNTDQAANAARQIS
jgi:hypothetical protein